MIDVYLKRNGEKVMTESMVSITIPPLCTACTESRSSNLYEPEEHDSISFMYERGSVIRINNEEIPVYIKISGKHMEAEIIIYEGEWHEAEKTSYIHYHLFYTRERK